MAGKHLAHISIRFGVDLKEFSTKMQNASRQIAKTGRKMQSVGASITRNMTLPIVAAGAAAAKLAIDFDDSMNKIQNLVGVAAEDVAKMRDGVLALAGDTAKAPQELGDALFVVTSAGKRGAEAMAILEQAAKASAVGMGDTTEIARALVAATTAYGEEVLSAERASEVFFKTIQAGNLDAESLAPNLGKVVGFAAQMGVSFDEVGANIAAYTRLGISAEEATTGLTAIMAAFAKPTEQAEKALANYGMTSQDVRNSIAQNGLAATLTNLMEVTDGNITALSEIIPNIRAFKNILGVAGKQGDQYQQIVSEITSSTGGLEEAFSNVSETVGFKFRKSLSSLKAAGTELGTKLFPILTKLVDKVTGMVDAFSKLSPEVKESRLKAIGFTAAVGPLLVVVGKALTVMNSLRLAFIGLSTALGPVGLAITAFIGVAGYVATQMWEVKDSTKSANDEFSVLSGKVVDGQNKLNSLFGALTRSNEGTAERRELIKSINSQYGQYLPNLLTEKSSIDDIKSAQEAANRAYTNRLLLMAQEEKRAEILQDAMNGITDSYGILTRNVPEFLKSSTTKAFDAFISEWEDFVDVYEGLDGSLMLRDLSAGGEFTKALTEEAKRLNVPWGDINSAAIKWLSTQEKQANRQLQLNQLIRSFGGTFEEVVEESSEYTSNVDGSVKSWNVINDAISQHLQYYQKLKDAQNRLVGPGANFVDTVGWASLGDIFTIPDDAFADADRSFANLNANMDETTMKAYALGGSIVSVFSALGESLTNGAKGFGDVIRKMISSLLQLASAAIFTQATVKGGLTGGLIAGLAGISLAQGLFSGLLSNVPAFAEGGIVNGPTLAMVGDNRSGKEAIIPLEKMSTIFGNMGGANVNVSVQDVLIEGDKLRIVMDKASNNYNRRR